MGQSVHVRVSLWIPAIGILNSIENKSNSHSHILFWTRISHTKKCSWNRFLISCTYNQHSDVDYLSFSHYLHFVFLSFSPFSAASSSSSTFLLFIIIIIIFDNTKSHHHHHHHHLWTHTGQMINWSVYNELTLSWVSARERERAAYEMISFSSFHLMRNIFESMRYTTYRLALESPLCVEYHTAASTATASNFVLTFEDWVRYRRNNKTQQSFIWIIRRHRHNPIFFAFFCFVLRSIEENTHGESST